MTVIWMVALPAQRLWATLLLHAVGAHVIIQERRQRVAHTRSFSQAAISEKRGLRFGISYSLSRRAGNRANYCLDCAHDQYSVAGAWREPGQCVWWHRRGVQNPAWHR